jgi:hypothetical protein
MRLLSCPFFSSNVELTNERRRHIEEHHPDLLPRYLDLLQLALADPDEVRRSPGNPAVHQVSRWVAEIYGGKHVVVVVREDVGRCWVMTAYVARRLAQGALVWERD